MTKLYIRKVYGRPIWRLLNARGESLGVFMSLQAAIAAKTERKATVHENRGIADRRKSHWTWPQ